MAPATQDVGDRERFAIATQEIHAFGDRLEHAELDAVVDELGEVPRARAARMHVSPFDGAPPEHRFDKRGPIHVAAAYGTRAPARAGDPGRGIQPHTPTYPNGQRAGRRK